MRETLGIRIGKQRGQINQRSAGVKKGMRNRTACRLINSNHFTPAINGPNASARPAVRGRQLRERIPHSGKSHVWCHDSEKQKQRPEI
jgi:hypothetical protein